MYLEINKNYWNLITRQIYKKAVRKRKKNKYEMIIKTNRKFK